MGIGDFDATEPFGATPALSDALQQLGETRTATAGSQLFHAGEEVRGVFLLIQGTVTLTLAEHGVKYRRVVGPGSVLGLPATMCMKPYSLTAEIRENVRYSFVACSMVKEFLRTRPDLCFQVVEILAREVREMRQATGEVASAATAFASV
jgi:CRP-like cAMP-binding protein